MCSETKKLRGTAPASHLLLYPLLLAVPSCRARLSISPLQAPEGEKGILFQTKLSSKELTETEKCPSMANSLDVSVFCFPPHDKRNVCFSFYRMDEGATKKFNLERSKHNRCQMLFLTFSAEEKCFDTPEIKTFPFGLLKGFVLSRVNIQLCFLTAARGLMGTVVKTEILTFPPLSSTRLPAHNNYMLITR